MTVPSDESLLAGTDVRRPTPTIQGDGFVLLPATIADQHQVYEWLAHSDIASAMNGPPLFPEKPIPTLDEFCDQDCLHYFTGSSPQLGRCYLIVVNDEAVGQVMYNDIHEREGRTRTELDIWMRSEKDCGRGFGTQALLALCGYLSERFGVHEFMVQPSSITTSRRAAHALSKSTPSIEVMTSIRRGATPIW